VNVEIAVVACQEGWPDGEVHRAGLKLSYARVSMLGQNLAPRQDTLKEAGCAKICIEQTSGAVMDRSVLCETARPLDEMAFSRLCQPCGFVV
jgi:hypothetical protein